MEEATYSDIREKYKTRIGVVLTKAEGAQLSGLLKKSNCANLTQLVKKVLRNDFVLLSNDEYEYLLSSSNHNESDIETRAKDLKREIILQALHYASMDELIKDLAPDYKA